MNAVLIAVAVMLVLSLIRVNVVLALVVGAIVGGLIGGLSIEATLKSFSNGLGDGANIALSYGFLGGFAVAISKTGIPQLLVNGMLKVIKKDGGSDRAALGKVLIILLLTHDGDIFAKSNTDSYRIHSITSPSNFTCIKYVENRSSFNRFYPHIWIDCAVYDFTVWLRVHFP